MTLSDAPRVTDEPRIMAGERALLVVLLGLFALLAIDSVRRENPTFDETAHLAAGISYVQTHDFRMNAEHPVLPKLLAGAAASLSGVRVRTDTEAWATGEQWDFAREVLYESGVGWRRIVMLGRLPMVLLGIVLGALVWRWTRAMAGPTSATVVLALYAFCPNLLAHAPLVTTDVPLTLCVVATAASLWQAWRTGRLGWITVAAVFVGLSMVTKFSAFSYAPAWALLALLPSERRTLGSGLVHLGVLAVLSAAFSELFVFVGYGFATDWTTIQALGLAGRGVTPETMSPLRRLPYEIMASVPWPSADFARGMKDILLFADAGHPVYLLGKASDRGWWWSPLVTLAVKMPLPVMILVAAAKIRLLLRRSDRRADVLFLLVPATLVLATNVAANLGLGVRHLLPMFPFLMMLAAWPLRTGWPARRPVRLALIGLISWQVAGAVDAHPHHIAYFNEIARFSGGGEKFLGDSNLDWGQDLSLAATRLKARGASRAILGYFGTASPFVEGVEWQVLPPTQRAKKGEDPWVVLPPTGDEWLVLSTTNRQGIYYRTPGGGQAYPWLQGVRPDEVVGNGTISLYEISKNADVQRGLGELYLRHGLVDEAQMAFLRTVERVPFDADSRAQLVRIYRGRGDLAHADSMVLAAPNPDPRMLLEWTSIRRARGDEAMTREAFNTSVRVFPNDAELKNAYAWWLQEIGQDLGDALRYADEAVEWTPDDPYFLDTRGMVHRRRGDSAKALVDFEAALKQPGGDLPAIRWHSALALADVGRRAEALEVALALAAREDLDDSLRAEVETWLQRK